jgi:hypothetical protein
MRRALAPALEDLDLVAEGEVLEDERATGLEAGQQGA